MGEHPSYGSDSMSFCPNCDRLIEFTQGYLRCFMDDENYMTKLNQKRASHQNCGSPMPTQVSPKVGKHPRRMSEARNGRLTMSDENTILSRKSEVLEETIKRLSPAEKIMFYVKFWLGCCGILYIDPPKRKKRCGFLSGPRYVCSKCLRKNAYFHSGFNLFEILIIITTSFWISLYIPKYFMQEKLQRSMEKLFC